MTAALVVLGLVAAFFAIFTAHLETEYQSVQKTNERLTETVFDLRRRIIDAGGTLPEHDE